MVERWYKMMDMERKLGKEVVKGEGERETENGNGREIQVQVQWVK